MTPEIWPRFTSMILSGIQVLVLAAVSMCEGKLNPRLLHRKHPIHLSALDTVPNPSSTVPALDRVESSIRNWSEGGIGSEQTVGPLAVDITLPAPTSSSVSSSLSSQSRFALSLPSLPRCLPPKHTHTPEPKAGMQPWRVCVLVCACVCVKTGTCT